MQEAEDAEAARFVNHLTGAVQRALRMTNDFAIHARPTLQSAILATIARNQSDVAFWLILAEAPDSDGVAIVRRHAKHLGVSLVERRTTHADWERLGAECGRSLGGAGPAPTSDAVAYFAAAQEAALLTPRLLVSTGGEEMLGQRKGGITAAAQTTLAESLRLQIRLPYQDRGMTPYVEGLSPDLRHGTSGRSSLLWRAAEFVNVPEDVLSFEEGTHHPRVG